MVADVGLSVLTRGDPVSRAVLAASAAAQASSMMTLLSAAAMAASVAISEAPEAKAATTAVALAASSVFFWTVLSFEMALAWSVPAWVTVAWEEVDIALGFGIVCLNE